MKDIQLGDQFLGQQNDLLPILRCSRRLFIILVSLTSPKKCLFPLNAYMVSCPTWSKKLGRTLVFLSLEKNFLELLRLKKGPCMSFEMSETILSVWSVEKKNIFPCLTHDWPHMWPHVWRILQIFWNHIFSRKFRKHTVKSRAVDLSTIQFLSNFGVLLTEMCY